MRYSTLQNYIEAVETLKKRCRGNCDLKVVFDDYKKPLYKVSCGVVCFEMDNNRGLYLFLNERSKKRYLKRHSKVDLRVGYLYVSVSDDDGFWADVVVGEGCTRSGNQKLENQERVFVENLRAIEKNGKWGFENRANEVVMECVWDEVEDFGEGRAVVKRGDFYGLIDNQGRVIVEPKYDDLSWDGSNYACGDLMGKWGVFDRGGRVVVDFLWDWVGEFSYGLAIVLKDDKYGFVNDKGEVVIEPKYEQVTSFNELGVASVVMNESEFFIDQLERRV